MKDIDSKDTYVSPYDQVANSPVARAIADVLAHTNLANSDGSANSADHWRDLPVLNASLSVEKRLGELGLKLD
jgi:hypothetical protein